MSLMKRCLDVLSYGAEDDKYKAAAFVIRSTVESKKDLNRDERRDLYQATIFSFCDKYKLKRTKLGKEVSGS